MKPIRYEMKTVSCKRGLRCNVPTCQVFLRACVPSHVTCKRVNVPLQCIYVAACHSKGTGLRTTLIKEGYGQCGPDWSIIVDALSII